MLYAMSCKIEGHEKGKIMIYVCGFIVATFVGMLCDLM